MSDPRDPAAAEPAQTPMDGLPEDAPAAPSTATARTPADFTSHAYDLGPDPWDPDAPSPAASEARPESRPEPRPALRPVPVEPAPQPQAEPAHPHHRDYGAGAPPEAFAAGEADHEIKRPAFAVYLLFLAGLMLFGAPAVVGVILAYRVRERAPGWLQSHYIYQIRTFWIAVAGAVIGLAGLTVGVGVAILMALVVWVTLRCFVGMVRLHRGEPIYNPQTWIV